MDAATFAKEWTKNGDALDGFDEEAVKNAALSDETKSYLAAGLPAEAAPFLVFGTSAGANLQIVYDDYDLPDEYEKYIIIGFTVFGDPICIDTSSENIVRLNHEENFSASYMNKSIMVLVLYLLEFRKYVDEILHPDANNREEIYNKYKNILSGIDQEDFEKGDWDGELIAVLEKY